MMTGLWGKLRGLLSDQNDKALWHQLAVTLVDKGLLGLIVVTAGLMGNWLLEEYKLKQTQAQTRAQFLLSKRLEAIQQLADAYGRMTGSFMTSTLQGGVPDKKQVAEFDRLLEGLYLLSNQHKIVLPSSFNDEVERQLWIYKGITHEDSAQWSSYREFIAGLSTAFETAWRRTLPTVEEERGVPEPTPGSFSTIVWTVQEATRQGTKTYFEKNFEQWKRQNPDRPTPAPAKPVAPRAGAGGQAKKRTAS